MNIELMTDNPWCLWEPSETGFTLRTFATKEQAELFVIKFGSKLEILPNTYECY